MKEVCIIGAGTYGCYLAKILIEKYSGIKINVIEVGDSKTKSESEIGFLSNLIDDQYNGAAKGRYFGLGGTSEKWGGQLLFFSENDCPNDQDMLELKRINKQYKDLVLSRIFKKVPKLHERVIENSIYIKQGIWLNYNKRNLFNLLKIASEERINVITNSRVIKINHDGGKVNSITIIREGQKIIFKSDLFFLTAGAFESMRLLDVSGVIDLNEMTLGFSDHVSIKCFKVLGNKANIESNDFSYRFLEKSLITSRIIGDIGGASYYAHPVFNEQFAIFQALKDLIFKAKLNISIKILTQIFHLIPFIFDYIFKNKIYIYKDWDMYIDIELDQNDNLITKSINLDQYGENGLEISYSIPSSTREKIEIAKKQIRDLLIKNNIRFLEIFEDSSCNKFEDAYHPFRLFKKEYYFDKRIQPFPNLFSINTGILPRAGGLNPTATLFCVLEEIVNSKIKI